MDVWTALAEDFSRRARRDAPNRLDTWRRGAPLLAGYRTAAEILDAIAQLGNPERSCALLGALLAIAKTEPLARYAVLVAIIPGLRAAARRRWRRARHDGPWPDRADLDADTISAAWQTIARHAGEGHLRPAQLIVRHVERQLRAIHDDYRQGIARAAAFQSAPSAQAADDGATAANLVPFRLIEAFQAGRIDSRTARLSWAVAMRGESLTTASHQLGINGRQARRSLLEAHEIVIGSPRIPEAARPLRFNQEDFPMLPLLLTVPQAAELLGVGRTTLYDLIRSEELLAVRRGATQRVPLWGVYDYVDRLCGGTQSSIPVRAMVDYLMRMAAADDQAQSAS